MEFQHEVSVTAEEEGAWVNLSLPDIRAKVRSIYCHQYKRAQAKALESSRKLSRGTNMDPVEIEELTNTIIAKHLILDVDGLMDTTDPKKPVPVKWTDKLGLELMKDRKHRKFQEAIRAAVGMVGDRDYEWKEEAAKNSEPASESKQKLAS